MRSPAAAAEISALDLARILDEQADLQIVDVRTAAAVAAGHIDTGAGERFHNIPGSGLLACRTLRETGLDPARPAIVVCSRGHDSQAVAAHLNAIGCAARSLQGGMAAWMRVLRARSMASSPGLDQLIQFDRPGPAALGYLLVSAGEALIVDPPRDATEYVDAARLAGADVVGVADTHLHADYISGASALARALGVPYYLHARDAVSPYNGVPGRLEFRPIADGDDIGFGRCRVRVVHTPGHTEGSVCYIVDDSHALTGDFLLPTSVGRPDLADRTAEWTADLWSSLELARTTWPHDLLVCPAHYASARDRRPDGVVAVRFGQLMRQNEAMRFTDPTSFARWVAAHSGSFPDTYTTIKAINLGLADLPAESEESLESGRNQCGLPAR